VKVDTSTGPEGFEALHPNVLDDILKREFPRVVSQNTFLRQACVAAWWLGLVTSSNREAAQMQKAAVQGGVDPYKAAVSVAKHFGWTPGQVVDVPAEL
jgi:hypothetical protein